ncbi:MAG: glycosyltransferase family 2 protein [Candidatus Margulisiibacteriota bacterium]
MVDLSIIIVNTNNKELLENCLKSIYAHTHRVTFEIIVVDNNSHDGSQQMVKNNFPKVILIENKENVGFIAASNQGLRRFKGRYALLLNDDTIVKDFAFDYLIEFMDNHPTVGACGPKLLNTNGTIQRQGGILGKKFWLSQKPIEVRFLVGACLMVRREVIEKVGILDENLFFYNDDLDWCLRIRKAGWKIYYLPQAEVVHYGGYSSKRVFNPKLFIEGFKGGLYFCRKHYGEFAYQIYRFLLAGSLCLVLPFSAFNPLKFYAYLEIIKIALLGQTTLPKAN